MSQTTNITKKLLSDNMITPRMYIIVRDDLSETYKMVQGSHALAQYAIEQPELFREWNNHCLIFLSVWNGLTLEKVKEELSGFTTAEFYEPDLGDKLTAIAIFENGNGKVSTAVKGYKLA
jgi:hypothetical protein